MCGAAAGVVLAGSAVAATSAVVAGASTLVGTVATGGITAGGAYIVHNIQQAFSSGTIVIGQTMERVTDKASQIGAETYKGIEHYGTLEKIMGQRTADVI